MKMVLVPARSLRAIVRALDGYATPNDEACLMHAIDNMRGVFSEEELSRDAPINDALERPAGYPFREDAHIFGGDI